MFLKGDSMPIIPLKYPNCGGDLQVDSEKDAAICSHCGKPYIVKDAIVNNYITFFTTNNITNSNNIKTDSVNINLKEDYVIRSGVLVDYRGESPIVEIPDNVTEIGENAFKGRKVTNVSIPSSVKRIGDNAFSGCTELTELRIPSSVETIGKQSAENLSLFFDENSKIEEVNKWDVKILHFPDGVTCIGRKSFALCSYLESITIPNSVKIIEGQAFWACTALRSVQFPDSPIFVDKDAFEGCPYKLEKGSYIEGTPEVEVPQERLDDVSSVLNQLGYKPEEITPVLDRLKGQHGSTDELIKIALGMLIK